MKTYTLETMHMLSEYYAGLITGIILSIAGNCTTYAMSGYGLQFNNHNVFEFTADEETKKNVKETIDAHVDIAYMIVENRNVVI